MFPDDGQVPRVGCASLMSAILTPAESIFSLDTSDNGIENGRLCLFDRGNGEVNRERCLPLHSFGVISARFTPWSCLN